MTSARSLPRLRFLFPGAALALCAAGAGHAAPVITEVAWMGSPSSANDEFVEVYNPGPDPIDLADYELLEGTTVHTLPSVTVPAGGVLVLEDSAQATSLEPDAAVVVGLSLNNEGEILRLCPAGQTADPGACDIANAGGGWAAGDRGSRRTMVRVDADAPGDDPSSWTTYAGPASDVTDRRGLAILGTPGTYEPLVLDAGPGDAGIVDAGPPPPPPVITEVAWMGTQAHFSHEWVELYNANAEPLDLSRFVLVDGTTERPLPAVTLPPGAFLVLEADPMATSLDDVGAPPAAATLSGLSLTNGGEALRVCPNGETGDVLACDVANPSGGAWFGGDNDTKATMVRLHPDLPGDEPGSWKTFDGAPSTVTDASGNPILGSPGAHTFELPPGGGVEDDGGVVPPPVDAGPNAPPTVILHAPAGQIESAGEVVITYSASDPDVGDAVEVGLFYDLDGQGNDGVRIASGLRAGSEVSYTWRTEGVPPGTYHVFAAATDLRGETAYAYAEGTVVVGGGAGQVASILLVEPDGVNDGKEGGLFEIRWEVSLPSDAEGAVSLFYDTDQEGLDGEPIIAGLPVKNPDGSDGPRGFVWDTTEVPPGSYAVYAILDSTRGSASAYSEFVTVTREGSCACRAASSGSGGGALLAMGLASLAWALRRRKRCLRLSQRRPTRGRRL